MNQFSMIEVFGKTTKKEVRLDNPLSLDQFYISSVSFFIDFVLHNFLAVHVMVINSGTSQHEVLIPWGAYDIEAIIAMLNASDAFLLYICV